jgi:hypothetical protein
MPIEQYYAILRKAGYTILRRIPGTPGSLLMQGREPDDKINVPAPEDLSFGDRLDALKGLHLIG